MLKLLQLLIFGHIHKWKVNEVRNLMKGKDSNLPYGKIVYYQCETCNKVKVKTLYN